ncbi:hypothetical protein MVI01_37960 [Myxococcus virescens]|uniref:Uncharacterized protein n=1 Tax=Myxococcus virescens TaxID=83456 RepID=A0A511HEN7_9BACT|nr:hypothetical protein MVI01_37960 [Myxococcus virescens]
MAIDEEQVRGFLSEVFGVVLAERTQAVIALDCPVEREPPGRALGPEVSPRVFRDANAAHPLTWAQKFRNPTPASQTAWKFARDCEMGLAV